MARIRTIKPEFWVDDVMVELPFEARLLFIGLWNFVDDEGFIEDKPKRIKMQIFPADDVLIEDSLSALCDAGRLHSFDSDQGPLLQVANWGRHQKINRATATRFSGITPRNRPSSVSAHAPISDDSRGKGKERKGKDLNPLPDESGGDPKSIYPDDFEQWWKSYPRKTAKGDALKAWKQLKRDRVLPVVDDLIAATEAYASREQRAEFQKYPAGWLRGHMWNDEPQKKQERRIPANDEWMYR